MNGEGIKGLGLRGFLYGLKEVLLLFCDFINNNVVFFFDFPAFCKEIRRVSMCVMKGSDDGRVILDLDLLAFLCFHVSELVVWQ